ncbi:MAG: hypothetical protein K6A23_07155 [Butyrivibrio sp.]|nr:hypothetical protein [Butyrivibrio sp.]
MAVNDSLRKDLVSQLAQSMGFAGEKKSEPSRYDPATGTVYCNGKMFTGQEMEAARQYCIQAAEKFDGYGDSAGNMMRIAAAAIEIIQKDSVKTGGTVVVKD